MRKAPLRFTTVLWLFGIAALACETRRAWRKRTSPRTCDPWPADRETRSPGTAAPALATEAPSDSPATSDPASLPRSRKKTPIQFATVLLLLGVLLLLAVAADMVLRGFWREIEPPVWETSRAATAPGRAAIVRYGCGGCHVIPGIRHATGRVGPQLAGFRDQMYIAGVLPNVPANLAAWIENPKQFNPGTAMPNLDVTPEEAWAMAMYLYAHP